MLAFDCSCDCSFPRELASPGILGNYEALMESQVQGFPLHDWAPASLLGNQCLRPELEARVSSYFFYCCEETLRRGQHIKESI